MRQGSNHRRLRGRGGNGGGVGGSSGGSGGKRHITSPRTQTYDSNGPGGRIRGNAYQVYERYLALARDAQGSGDRVMAENMMQHAEHYFRIIAASNEVIALRGGGRPFDGNVMSENRPHEGSDQGPDSAESEDIEQPSTT